MARMLPPYVSDEVRSTGERQIFDLFENGPGTEDWVVLHSLGLARHTRRLYGEIDFLVFAPALGIFCLEVKSGDVRREGGLWKLTNRFGEITTGPRNPFQQAEDGMFSLIDAVRKKFGENSRPTRLLFGFGVMFPHVLFRLEGPEMEPWQIYDRDSRRLPIRDYVVQLSRHTCRKVEHCRWFDRSESMPKKADVDQLVSYFRGDFERIVTPKQMLSDVEEQLNQYTAEQCRCLDGLEDNPRCLFQGAAGTGKTMIALESVRRGLFKNQRTLMACFNSLLGGWLVSQFAQGELGSRAMAGSFHQLLTKISQVPDDCLSSASDRDEFFKYELPILALDAVDCGRIAPFDRIVVDEGQDLIRPEYLDVFDALLKGGIAGGRWEIYCDLERQAIYSEFAAHEMVQMLESRATFARFRLTVNCRNTKPIGEEIRLISGFEAPAFLPGRVSGMPVEYYFYEDNQQQARRLESVLLRLRRQKIPPSNVTILSPFRLENSCVAGVDRGTFNISNLADSSRFAPVKSVTFSTIHGFKGLENSYVILTDIDRIGDDEFRSLLYVGMSRAKVGLVVLANERARDEYNRLVRQTLKNGAGDERSAS
jgi:hypothetical protein